MSTHDDQAFLLALDAAIDALAAKAPPAPTAEATGATWLAGLLDEAVPAPSPSAKARGKARLLAELAAIEQKEAAPALARWRRWLGTQPRWALAGGAAVLAVAAGSVTVSQASRAIPGQPLHAIKRGTEGVNLATTQDSARLASLNMGMAAERASEASRLLLAGDVTAATPLAESMAAFVAGAVLASGGVDDPAKAVALAHELATTAQTATAALQTAARWTGPEGQEAARTALAEASALYAGAVEQAMGSVSGGDARGTVSVRVSLPEGGAGTLLSAEVFRPGNGWVQVSAAGRPQTVQPADDGQVPVGGAQVSAGTYTRVRLSFDDAGDGDADTVETRRPFNVPEDGETVVSVDLTRKTPVLFTYNEGDAPPPVQPATPSAPAPQGTAPEPPAAPAAPAATEANEPDEVPELAPEPEQPEEREAKGRSGKGKADVQPQAEAPEEREDKGNSGKGKADEQPQAEAPEEREDKGDSGKGKTDEQPQAEAPEEREDKGNSGKGKTDEQPQAEAPEEREDKGNSGKGKTDVQPQAEAPEEREEREDKGDSGKGKADVQPQAEAPEEREDKGDSGKGRGK